MSVLRNLLMGAIAVTMLTGTGAGCSPPAEPKVPAEQQPDQQVAELVEAYLALPAEAKLGIEGDRILERLRMVRGELSPKSQEAIARLDASSTLRRLAQVLQTNDQEGLKDLVSKQAERETLAERLTDMLPYVEPSSTRKGTKPLAGLSTEKRGEGPGAPDRDAAPRQGWEYASLSIDAKAGGLKWVTPTASAQAGEFPKLCEKIGLDLADAYKRMGYKRLPMAEILGHDQPTVPQFDRADHTVFCNHVGKDGWELVQHLSPAYTAPYGPADVWIFKRPSR
jgi:hypothetical protein